MRIRGLAILTLMTAVLSSFAGAQADVVGQDDAGSGRDAPDSATADVFIESGVVYTGSTLGSNRIDGGDWYAFHLVEGQTVNALLSSAFSCGKLTDENGMEIGTGSCSAATAQLVMMNGTARRSGIHFFNHLGAGVDRYSFSIGIDEPAPEPFPTSTVSVGQGGPLARLSPASQTGPHAVVAVVDTGINPYHRYFRAPALTAHPSGWLPGFPSTATALDLNLDASDLASARAADLGEWRAFRRSSYRVGRDDFDAHLSTIPGTRIVGAISFGEYVDPLLPPTAELLPVIDDNGHGTHSAGLASGANLGQAEGNVLIVAVEVGQASFAAGVRWAARQPWIDAISVSLATTAGVSATTSSLGDRDGMEWATIEAARAAKPVLVASGNGVTGAAIAPDHCTTYTSAYAGPPWITRIGAAEPHSGNPSWWHCAPVDAIARTRVLSPNFDSLTEAGEATGTSAATPNAGAAYANLLLDARRAGSTAARNDVLAHLLAAARPVAAAPGLGREPSVEPVSAADQGYGLVDAHALQRARTTLLSGGAPEPRPELATWFEQDRAIRTALWGPGSVNGGDPIPQDDGAAGRDAPDGPNPAFTVQPNTNYSGQLGLPTIDGEDWYGFGLQSGQPFSVRATGRLTCLDLVDPNGVVLDSVCLLPGIANTLSATASVAGVYYARYRGVMPDFYTLRVTAS